MSYDAHKHYKANESVDYRDPFTHHFTEHVLDIDRGEIEIYLGNLKTKSHLVIPASHLSCYKTDGIPFLNQLLVVTYLIARSLFTIPRSDNPPSTNKRSYKGIGANAHTV